VFQNVGKDHKLNLAVISVDKNLAVARHKTAADGHGVGVSGQQGRFPGQVLQIEAVAAGHASGDQQVIEPRVQAGTVHLR
jgi:hypothetical protein